MTADVDLSLEQMLDLLRRNGFGPLGIPVCGGAAVDPALAHYRNGVMTMLVLPTYGAATVARMECVNDRSRPDWIVKSVTCQWTAPKEDAARWLLEDYGLLPSEVEQP
jgi:hypothetical protein